MRNIPYYGDAVSRDEMELALVGRVISFDTGQRAP